MEHRGAVVLALENQNAVGKVMNIAGSRCVSILELAQAVIRTVGSGYIQLDPGKNSDSRFLGISISQGKKVIGYKPQVPLSEGLKKTLNWIENNRDYYQSL